MCMKICSMNQKQFFDLQSEKGSTSSLLYAGSSIERTESIRAKKSALAESSDHYSSKSKSATYSRRTMEELHVSSKNTSASHSYNLLFQQGKSTMDLGSGSALLSFLQSCRSLQGSNRQWKRIPNLSRSVFQSRIGEGTNSAQRANRTTIFRVVWRHAICFSNSLSNRISLSSKVQRNSIDIKNQFRNSLAIWSRLATRRIRPGPFSSKLADTI